MLCWKIPRSPTILVFCTSLLLILVKYGGECVSPNYDYCRGTLASANVEPDYFCFYTAHGLHSLKIEHVKHYLGVDLPDNNFIPSVQISGNKFQQHLPRMSRNPDGASFTMQNLDYRLSNYVDWEPRFGIGMLEKLAHDAHMHTLWTGMKSLYEMIQRNPPHHATCGCLRNENNNGIIGALQLLQYRYSDGEYYDNSKSRYWWSPYKCGQLTNYNAMTSTSSGQGPPRKPRIENPYTWNVWKTALKNQLPKPNENYQFALYLYCKLNPYAK